MPQEFNDKVEQWLERIADVLNHKRKNKKAPKKEEAIARCVFSEFLPGRDDPLEGPSSSQATFRCRPKTSQRLVDYLQKSGFNHVEKEPVVQTGEEVELFDVSFSIPPSPCYLDKLKKVYEMGVERLIMKDVAEAFQSARELTEVLGPQQQDAMAHMATRTLAIWGKGKYGSFSPS